MELIKVQMYMVDVSLMAPDLALLAEACDMLADQAIERAREADMLHVRTMGAAFKAAHLAALAQWCMCHKCKGELKDAIAEAIPPGKPEIPRTG